ncbi:DUF4345 domain-containing protein [Elioraea sp.]|uniref:DUF4345 domain-containing protein n=1 Tax=Elioraea sp. TaxID=2185103 RepID=UPI0025C66646|nr:DUF4345 domain-containing protein [Elioraea sp.]
MTQGAMVAAAIAVAALVPLAAGVAGVATGFGFLGAGDLPIGAASHARYLSGLLLGLGLASLWCAARLGERRGVFATLCLVVIVGGAARAVGLVVDGMPPWEHVAALVMELGVVPALLAASRTVPHT